MTVEELKVAKIFLEDLEQRSQCNEINTLKEALEKQMAKIPNYEGNGYYNGELVLDTWICPNCGNQYEVDYEEHDYCPKCGQHIDHSTLTEDD